MTKADLINEIAISSGFDKKTIAVIVEGFMTGVKKNLAKGDNVYLRSFHRVPLSRFLSTR